MKKFLDCISVVGTTPSRFQGTKKYVSTGAVATTVIDETEVVEVTYDDRPSRANLSAEAGDILFAKMQGTRKTLLLDSETEKNIYSTGFYAVRANSNVITTECLYYLIDSELFLMQKDKNCSGATQKAITNGGLAKIEIRVPSLSEQAVLTEKLRYITQMIDDKRKQLELFDQIIKSRFIEMFGDPKTNPNSFDIVSFNECVEYMGDIGSNGANQVVVDHLDMKDEEDYALMVRFLNFTKNDFTVDVKYISKESYEFFKKSQIFGGELIICKIGSAGQNYVMPYLNRPVSLGLNQIMVRINEKTLMPYLYRYINSDYGKQLISGCINGAVTKSITKTELKKIPVMIPPMELQNEFVAFIEQTDKSKFEIQKSIEKLEILKKSLMQQYFG